MRWRTGVAIDLGTVNTLIHISGRGLVIVSALAAQWGAYRVPSGKIVWAMLK